MPSACVRVLPRPPYYGDKMATALRRMGYRIVVLPERAPNAGDVLVIWNRYGRNHTAAVLFEKYGGTVVVAENGYLGHDADRRQLYALGLDGHCGSGRRPVGGPDLRLERSTGHGIPRLALSKGRPGLQSSPAKTVPGTRHRPDAEHQRGLCRCRHSLHRTKTGETVFPARQLSRSARSAVDALRI